MKPNRKTPAAATSANPLAGSLNQVLADSYALMALTHLAHWNIEGRDFFSLHTAFQTQYEELFTAIDEIAERVRALDAYAIGGLSRFAAAAGMANSRRRSVRRTMCGHSSLPTRSWWWTRSGHGTWRERRGTARVRT